MIIIVRLHRYISDYTAVCRITSDDGELTDTRHCRNKCHHSLWLTFDDTFMIRDGHGNSFKYPDWDFIQFFGCYLMCEWLDIDTNRVVLFEIDIRVYESKRFITVYLDMILCRYTKVTVKRIMWNYLFRWERMANISLRRYGRNRMFSVGEPFNHFSIAE